MLWPIEARVGELVPGDIGKGISVVIDKSRPETARELPLFDVQQFDQLAISHIVSIIGRERFVRDYKDNSVYDLRFVVLGGIMGAAMQSIEYNKIAAWLRVLHKAEDELQAVGKLTLQYATQSRPRILNPCAVVLDRNPITLDQSRDYIRRSMIPVLGNNFEYKLD